MEDQMRDTSDKGEMMWLIIECVFTTFFLGEFIVKLIALKCAYFKSWWNVFDLLLVVVGIAGIALEFHEMVSSPNDSTAESVSASTQARMIRINRIFRVARIVRAFRLVRFVNALRLILLQQDISFELMEQLRSVYILFAFVKAHRRSQKLFLHFFGDQGSVSCVEQARCILESQAAVYKASYLAIKEATRIDDIVLTGIFILKESNSIAEDLTSFVFSAFKAGVITSREADSICEPLKHHQKHWDLKLRQSHRGFRHGRINRDSSMSTIVPSSAPSFRMSVEGIARDISAISEAAAAEWLVQEEDPKSPRTPKSQKSGWL
jgi:hypothetical protein